MTRVLAAGDHFVLNRLFVDALHREIPDGLEVSELTLPWPVEPFGRVGEVDEASGSEDAMIEALRGVEVCVTQLAPLTEKILEASPDLRLFCISRGGPAEKIRPKFGEFKSATGRPRFTWLVRLNTSARN